MRPIYFIIRDDSYTNKGVVFKDIEVVKIYDDFIKAYTCCEKLNKENDYEFAENGFLVYSIEKRYIED